MGCSTMSRPDHEVMLLTLDSMILVDARDEVMAHRQSNLRQVAIPAQCWMVEMRWVLVEMGWVPVEMRWVPVEMRWVLLQALSCILTPSFWARLMLIRIVLVVMVMSVSTLPLGFDQSRNKEQNV